MKEQRRVEVIQRVFRGKLGIAEAALVLGPMMETSLRRSLLISRGSFQIFLTRPISAVLMLFSAVVLLNPLVRALKGTAINFSFRA